ncbi:hypothetical protein DFH09DRAFT_1382542 [Mycena vulgaris]|nr:hypothetical protein DFH09DRAFT_1382542 [Mycena vulgaris]
MALFRRISRGILSYRVGYSPQRPYPWRLRLAALGSTNSPVFTGISTVPLSAYEVVQEFTYRPNDTLPPLPFSNLIPEMLQHPTGGFTPQITTVGDTFNLNNTIVNWTITAAFDDVNSPQPVQTFSYYNNPFSDGCYITDMTISLTGPPGNNTSLDWPIQYTVHVTCDIPTLFTLSWNGGYLASGGNPAGSDLNKFTGSLEGDVEKLILRLSQLSLPPSMEPDTFVITVQPCCECGEVTAATSKQLPTQAPCRLRPARFSRVNSYLEYPDNYGSTSDGFSGENAYSVALNTMFLNTFQSLYHLVRLELGLILENQIYASAEMYNHSIAPVYLPGIYFAPWVNGSLASISNATVMAEWQDSVRSFQESDRVPVMLYLRSVPRLKPLGSAITSVFVSTSAMLSVLWTLFSLIAGSLAGLNSDR